MKLHTRIQKMGDRYIRRTCLDFPQWGSGLGFTTFEGSLGGSKTATRLQRIGFLEGLLLETEGIRGSDLSGDEWLDRRCLLSLLRTELLLSRDLERWRTNPQEYCDIAVSSVFELVTRYSNSLHRARPMMESRFAAIPGFLNEGAASIRNPVPLWTKLAVRSCKGASEFVLSVGEAIAKDSPHPSKTRRLAQAAAEAFDHYAKAVLRKKQGSPGSFAIGRGTL